MLISIAIERSIVQSISNQPQLNRHCYVHKTPSRSRSHTHSHISYKCQKTSGYRSFARRRKIQTHKEFPQKWKTGWRGSVPADKLVLVRDVKKGDKQKSSRITSINRAHASKQLSWLWQQKEKTTKANHHKQGVEHCEGKRKSKISAISMSIASNSCCVLAPANQSRPIRHTRGILKEVGRKSAPIYAYTPAPRCLWMDS